MPFDKNRFKLNADELRGMLGSVAHGLSDRAVMERALVADERVIPKDTKDYLRREYGESFWSSAGKSFMRSSMLDTAGDLVGLETTKMTESAPIQEDQNTYGSMLGGVGGMLALQAIPVGGQALGAGRLGTMALRAALQAGAGANTNWREQQDQMRVGDRLAMSPGTAGWSATTSGLGQVVGGSAGFNRLQDKGWDVGSKLVKQAFKGGVSNPIRTGLKGVVKASASPALEAGANIGEETAQYLGEGMWDDRNLTRSGREGKAGYLQRVGMTGAFGAAADLGLNRTIGGMSDWRKARGVVKGDDLDADELDPDDITALKEPAANVTDRPDPVEADMQGNPPHALAKPWTEILTAEKAGAFKGARNRAVLQYGAEKVAQMEAEVLARMRTDKPDKYYVEQNPNDPTTPIWMPVYNIGDQQYGWRRSDEKLINITPDPEMGDLFDLRNQTVIQRLGGTKHRQPVGASYTADHRAVPGKKPITAEFDGKQWRIVTHRRDKESGPAVRWIGAVPLVEDPLKPGSGLDVPPGLHSIQEFELDSLKHKLIQDALAAAFAESRAKRKGTSRKPVYQQGDLLALAEEKSGQAALNESVPKLVQLYSQAGGQPIDLNVLPNVAMPPPIRGLGDDEGEGGVGGGGGGPAPTGSGGGPAAPPGASPSGGKPVVKLDPNQLPPLDPELLMEKWQAGGDLSPEEKAFLVEKGLLRQSPISGDAQTGIDLDVGERDALRTATGAVGLAPTVTPNAPGGHPARRYAEEAVRNGYPGTVEQAQADIVERARELHASEHADDATTTGQGLLQTIADLGGILIAPDPMFPGEQTWIREFRDAGGQQIGGVSKVFRNKQQMRGNEGELSTTAGHTLSSMAEKLQNAGFAISDGGQLADMITQAKRDYDNGISSDFDIGKYAGGIRQMLGEKWWGDGRGVPAPPKQRKPRAPRKPKVVETAPVVPTGPSRRQQAEDLMVSAAEAYDAYHQRMGKRATDAEAQTIFANRLGKAGIQLVLAEGQIAPDEAARYMKLLRKKF